jgi:predicted dehydrogenase
MGQVHSRSYLAACDRFSDDSIRARLVICADEVVDRAREARERFGFEECTTDWRRVVAHPDVQAVNVTSPNYLHVEMVKAATAAGKHVFCEKPVGRNGSETAEIARSARQAGVLTWVGYNYRWAPVVQYARQLIQAGKLGDITHYRGRFLVDYGSNPDGVLSWRFQRELAGHGVLGDLMSHVVDMANMLAGPIRRVVAQQHTFVPTRPLPAPGQGTHFSTGAGGPRAPVTNEDYVGALARFACGAVGTLEVCRVAKGARCEMAFEVHGTRGALRWNFERMNELSLFARDGADEHDGPVLVQAAAAHPGYSAFNPGPAISMSYEDLKVIEARQFLKSIVEGRQGAPGFAEAARAAAVQEAIARSWTSEKWEDVVPLDDGDAGP